VLCSRSTSIIGLFIHNLYRQTCGLNPQLLYLNISRCTGYVYAWRQGHACLHIACGCLCKLKCRGYVICRLLNGKGGVRAGGGWGVFVSFHWTWRYEYLLRLPTVLLNNSKSPKSLTWLHSRPRSLDFPGVKSYNIMSAVISSFCVRLDGECC